MGPYAEDAKRLIRLPYLLRFTNAQDMERDEIKDRWLRLYIALELKDFEDKGYLRVLQEYIAVTPPEERCPCRKGRRLIHWEHRHFPQCPHATLHGRMREHWERWVAIRKRHRDHNEQQKLDVALFHLLVRLRVLKRMPRSALRRIKRMTERLLP